ncbi:MAG: hypothetical protein AYK22_05175 [Thermoplasmatales archaeon SG8-52-3]|nr:MAG: hypothetical protein AYK22_05175 [Thermoplasmatales archaeon SG8-52-3]
MNTKKTNVSSDLNFNKYMSERKEMIEDCLDSMLPELKNDELKDLTIAMRHTLFAGGKRIRPILTIAIYEYSKGEVEKIILPACCIELFHTASLMLDDLPVMDNASIRRGKPVIHKIVKSQITILAATSIAAKGFEILSRELSKRDISASVLSMLIEMSAKMLGFEGASGGQYLDLSSKILSEEDLLYIHMKKTSSLFYLCGLLGAEIGKLNTCEKGSILEYVRHVGLLFQLVDDSNDINTDKKYNFANIFGTNNIKIKIEDEKNQALYHLNQLKGDTTTLRKIVDYIVSG